MLLTSLSSPHQPCYSFYFHHHHQHQHDRHCRYHRLSCCCYHHTINVIVIISISKRGWRVILHISLIPKVIPLKLFLGMVFSSSADVTCSLRGYFRGVDMEDEIWYQIRIWRTPRALWNENLKFQTSKRSDIGRRIPCLKISLKG